MDPRSHPFRTSGDRPPIEHSPVLDASPNAIVSIDASGVITYANPKTESAFGYTREEILGQPIEVLLPERLRGQHLGHRNGFLARPAARPMGIGLDLSARRKDGSEFPVEISLSPVDTSDGIQVFATVVDITARKAAEGQLLQAQKLESLGRLLAGSRTTSTTCSSRSAATPSC